MVRLAEKRVSQVKCRNLHSTLPTFVSISILKYCYTFPNALAIWNVPTVSMFDAIKGIPL